VTEHDTTGYDCWCGPTFLDAESGAKLTREQAEQCWDAVLTVHHNPRDDRRDHDRHPARIL
jgi:hypothetical protein